MSYIRQTWVDNSSIVDAEKLNHIEDGIYENSLDNVYSTDETFIGKYWIDGKPIYRKVVSYELTQDYAYPEFSTGITNAEYIRINITRYYGTDNRYAKDASALNYYFDRATGNVVFIEVEDNVLKPPLGLYQFIIEYTKTTN